MGCEFAGGNFGFTRFTELFPAVYSALFGNFFAWGIALSVPQFMSIEAALTIRNTQLKNWIFIALVVMSNSVGNLLMGFAMERMPDFSKTTLLTYLFAASTNIWLLLGMALMIVYMIAQLSMFSWADLSYVLPMTASTYVVSALLSKFFLHETVSAVRWLGIALISFGVIFVAETPVREQEKETESVPG